VAAEPRSSSTPGIFDLSRSGRVAEGACGYLSKVLTGPAIVEALERIMSGEMVIMSGDHETSVGGAR
jgi:hypothetical protein